MARRLHATAAAAVLGLSACAPAPHQRPEARSQALVVWRPQR